MSESKREMNETLTNIARIVAEATGFDGEYAVEIDTSDPRTWAIVARFGDEEQLFYINTLNELQEAVEAMVEWMLKKAGGNMPPSMVWGNVAKA